MYNRYAESARVNWASNFALMTKDPSQKQAWNELCTPKGGVGLILRSIRTDYKFVCIETLSQAPTWHV